MAALHPDDETHPENPDPERLRKASASTHAPVGYLFVRLPEANFGQVHVLRGEILLGSDATNHIRLTENSIAPAHARIVQQGSRFVLHDLSDGAVRVNNAPLSGPRTLAENDHIDMGAACEFVFKMLR
ncbi:MAG: FHA domain-containing protein [Chloroflexota bacterium]